MTNKKTIETRLCGSCACGVANDDWTHLEAKKPKVTPQASWEDVKPVTPAVPDTSTYTKIGEYQGGEVEGFVYELPDKWALQATDKDSGHSILSGIVHLPKNKWPTLEDAKRYLSSKTQ